MSRSNLVIAVTGVVAAVLLFVVAPVGFVAVLAWLIVAPPWGRTLAERAVVSLLVVLAAVAVVVPRAGSTPVTPLTAHLLLAAIVVLVIAIRFAPRLRDVGIPRPTWVDGLLALAVLVIWWWLAGPYLGVDAVGTVNGLFFSGWDNQGHFTTFANTYATGSTTWPTLDGSIAWNQWYPNLHTTVWALGDMALTGSASLDRIGLLSPYVHWSAVSYGLCAAALAWMGSDLAGRLAGWRGVGRTLPSLLAAGAVLAFMLLGSPAWLFNSGFTNYLIAVTVAAVAGYVSSRSWRSARTLGVFLIPLAALVVNGLWTPLVLALVLPGLIVFIAVWRVRWWLGVVWAVGTGALVGGVVWWQARAILTAGGASADTGSFSQELGAVGVGMTPFNLSAALAFCFVSIVAAAVSAARRRWPLAVALVGPSVGIVVVLGLAVSAADSAGITRLISYYVLKTMNALLLANAAVVAALIAVAVAMVASWASGAAPGRAGRAAAAGVVACSAALGLASFGYLGVVPDRFPEGVQVAPGLAAHSVRVAAIHDNLVGEAIVNAALAASPRDGRITMLWDGSGQLPNLWVNSLSGVLSLEASQFYGRLPQFPYDVKTVDFLDLAMNTNPALELEILWFREPSGVLLQDFAARHPGKVNLVQVPMSSSALCPECTGALR